MSDSNFTALLHRTFVMMAFGRSLSVMLDLSVNGFDSNKRFRVAMIFSFANSNLIDLLLILSSSNTFCSNERKLKKR